jgi:signal peptidase II
LKKFILPCFVIGLILLADQSLKYWVHTHIYESHKVIFPNWFLLYYTENNGMAFGVEFGGIAGKLVLTVFRILAVIAIVWYIVKQIRLKAPAGFVICVSMILAGAVGNIIDSVFYGVLYRSQNLPLFQGRVIDMLYFPLIDSYLPNWLPYWGGERFQFFRPVFNIADASISIGIISILLFQKRFFKHKEEPKVEPVIVGTETMNTDTLVKPERKIYNAGSDEDTAKSVDDDNSLDQNATESETTF